MNSKVKLNLFTIAQLLIEINFVFNYTGLLSYEKSLFLINISNLIFLVLIIYDFIYKPSDLKTNLKIFLLIIFGYLGSSITNTTYLLNIILAVLAVKDLNIDKILERDLIIRSVLVSVQLILFELGISTDLVYQNSMADRYSLGFGHPNSLGNAVTIVAIEMLYVTRHEKLVHKIFAYLFSLIVLFGSYQITKSRSSFVILVIALIGFFILNFKKKKLNSKIISFILEISFCLFAILSFVFVYMYAKGLPIAETLNWKFSNRLMLAKQYIDMYGISLLGKSTTISGTAISVVEGVSYYVVDMGFIFWSLNYGILSLLFLAVLYFLSFKNLIKKNNLGLICACIAMFAYGLMETGVFTYDRNPFLLALVYGIFTSDNSEEVVYDNNKSISNLVLSVLLIVLVCFNSSITGNSSLFLIDNTGMLDHYYLIDGLRNFKLSTYSSTLGLGTNVFNILKEGVLNPINFLSLLIPSRYFNYTYFYLNIIKLLVLSIGSYLWLKKDNKATNALIASIIITLSGVMVSSFSLSFFEAYCLLPLELYFIDKALSGDLIGLVITTILVSISGPSYIIPISILLVLYLVIKYFESKDIKRSIIVLISIILGILASSIVVLPILNLGNTLTNEYSLFDLLITLIKPFNGSLDYKTSIYMGLGTLIVLPSVFKDKDNIPSIVVLCISFILACVFVKSYGVSVFFIPLFVYVYMLVKTMDKGININASIITGAILLVLYIVISIINTYDMTLYIYHVVLAALAILLCVIAIKKFDIKAINLLIVFELLLSTFYFASFNSSIGKSGLIDDENTSVISEIENSDTSYYKTLGTSQLLSQRSDSSYAYKYSYSDYVNNLRGLSTSVSTYNPNQEDYLNLLNADWDNSYMGYKKNIVSYYDIAGLKYIYTNTSYKSNVSSINMDYVIDTYSLAKANTNTLSNGVYTIKSLENSSLSINEGTFPILSDTNNSTTNQKWNISHNYQGFIIITSVESNKVLELNQEDYTSLFLNDPVDDNMAQKWVAVKTSENGYDILSALTPYKKLTMVDGQIVLADRNDSDASKWIIENNNEELMEYIPSYFSDLGNGVYQNKYYVELGYINNNTINSDFLKEQNSFTIEQVLKEYVAIDSSDNTSFELSNSPSLLIDYSYESPITYEFEEPISNTTLTIANGGIPLIDVELYNGETLIKSKHYYQYDYCNITINENESVTKILIYFTDVDGTGYGIPVYTLGNIEVAEANIYNKKVSNSFTNVKYEDDHISGDISANEDNSLVYTYVPYDENWTITVDGQEVEKIKANYGFIAFRVNSGNHNVEFNYEIPSFGTYKIISIVSLVGAVVICVIDTIKKTNNKHEDNINEESM